MKKRTALIRTIDCCSVLDVAVAICSRLGVRAQSWAGVRAKAVSPQRETRAKWGATRLGMVRTR